MVVMIFDNVVYVVTAAVAEIVVSEVIWVIGVIRVIG